MVERKNLILLIFVLIGMVLALTFLNLKGQVRTGQNVQKIEDYQPVKLSKSRVQFFKVGGLSDEVLFYEEIGSMIYRAGPDGNNKKPLARIPGAKEVIFSPDGKGIIALVSERGELKKYYFDLIDNKRITLDPKIKNAAFSPDGSKIAYYLYDNVSGEGNISITKKDDFGLAVIFKTRIKELDLAWPEEDRITFSSFAIKSDGTDLQRSDTSKSRHLEGLSALKDLGIEASRTELTLSGNYLIYLNAGDQKLYSLKLSQISRQ